MNPVKFSRKIISLIRFRDYSQSRLSMKQSLSIFARNGQLPVTVFDVGAAFGTPDLYFNFPNAKFVLIEPLIEFSDSLSKMATEFANFIVVNAAAGPETKKGVINVHRDLVGSSSLLEMNEDDSVNGEKRSIEFVRLDDLVTSLTLEPPFFIKIDTQGSELEVLRGATQILPKTIGIVIEVSLFEFFHNGPLFQDVVSHLTRQGFMLYDIIELKYRPYDGALGQFDALFVPINDRRRSFHGYATKDQRRSNSDSIISHLRNRGINAR